MLNPPCVSCAFYIFSNDLEHVCQREHGVCSRCRSKKKKCDKIPDKLLPLVEELFRLLDARKYSRGTYLQAVDEEMAKQAIKFKQGYNAHVKELKEQQLAYKAKREQKTSPSSYVIRSRSKSRAVVGSPYTTRSKTKAVTDSPLKTQSKLKAATANTAIVISDSESPSSADLSDNNYFERLRVAMRKMHQNIQGLEKACSEVVNLLEAGVPSRAKLDRRVSTSPTLSPYEDEDDDDDYVDSDVETDGDDEEYDRSGKISHWDIIM